MLRPDPVPSDRGYEKGEFNTSKLVSFLKKSLLFSSDLTSFILRSILLEPLGPRDPYSRDLYYERRSDPYMDRRDYSRERDFFREKPPPEYERERYERERYPPRDRDDR